MYVGSQVGGKTKNNSSKKQGMQKLGIKTEHMLAENSK